MPPPTPTVKSKHLNTNTLGKAQRVHLPPYTTKPLTTNVLQK